jgi:hypothetical protein
MRKINLFFSLAPAPVFLIGAVWSFLNIQVLNAHHVCGGSSWEMPVMWLIMAIAHTSPWLVWGQQRKLQRFQTLPDKQQ